MYVGMSAFKYAPCIWVRHTYRHTYRQTGMHAYPSMRVCVCSRMSARAHAPRTQRVVHEVELRIKQIQIQVHEFTDTLRHSNLAELMLAFHKAHHPEDRVDPARYKGLTNALQRDIKEYLTGNVRAYGTSMGQESKTLHTISKLLNKTVSGMV